MADAPKKRPWLQFHLSMAVVLMFVAGGLMWLNLRPPMPNVIAIMARGSNPDHPYFFRVPDRYLGWPFEIQQMTITVPAEGKDLSETERLEFERFRAVTQPRSWGVTVDEFRACAPSLVHRIESDKTVTWHWAYANAFYNILIALAILLSVGTLLEWLIRRQERP